MIYNYVQDSVVHETENQYILKCLQYNVRETCYVPGLNSLHVHKQIAEAKDSYYSNKKYDSDFRH